MEQRCSIYHIEKHLSSNQAGLDKKLNTPWIVWIQKQSSKKDYTDPVPIYKFDTIAGFWFVINNIGIPTGYRIIVMREGISPIWEDPNHVCGGYCIISPPKASRPFPSYDEILDELYHGSNELPIHSYTVFIHCLLGIIGETFCTKAYPSENITGIMYVDTYGQTRIWISDFDILLNETTISYEYLKLIKGKMTDMRKLILNTPFNRLAAKQKSKENVANFYNELSATGERKFRRKKQYDFVTIT